MTNAHHDNQQMDRETQTGEGQPAMQSLERAITDLGAVILEIKMNGETGNEEKIEELETRYTHLRNEFEAFEKSEQRNIGTVSPEPANGSMMEKMAAQSNESLTRAQKRMNEAFENLKAYANDPENREAFKKNARDMGTAFADAWTEMSRGFERAFSRLRNKSATDEKTDQHGKPQ